MRALSIAILAGFVLASVPALADAQAQQAKPPVQTPPAAQKPAARLPLRNRPRLRRLRSRSRRPAPFPEGARFAYVNLQGVAAESVEGKGYSAQVQTLQQRRASELDAKNRRSSASSRRCSRGPTR